MSSPQRAHRTGIHRTGSLRTGTHRTGAVRAANRRPELRLVTGPVIARTRAPGRPSRRAPFVLLVLGLIAATTLSLLVLNTAIAVDSLHASSLRRDNARKVEQVQQLERRVIAGDTPQQLAAAAAAAGLVPAGRAGYLVVEPDGTSTLRGTPSPAPSPPPSPAPTQPAQPQSQPPAQQPTQQQAQSPAGQPVRPGGN